jgi:uncharacterized protein (TIGR03118 family)
MKKNVNLKVPLITFFIFILSFLFWLSPDIKNVNLLKQTPGKLAFLAQTLVNDGSHGGGIGLEFGHSGRVWLNTIDGHSIVYSGKGEQIKTKDVDGKLVDLKVVVPGVPTGMVFSDENSFKGDAFIFVTTEGKIFGWHKLLNGIEPLVASLRVDNSDKGSDYMGATQALVNGKWILYVTDWNNNKIEMYDDEYNLISDTRFVDPNLPETFTANNIKNIDDKLYVTYTDDGEDGNGIINIFDLKGNFIKRLVTGGELQSPYGLAKIHPSSQFYGGELLVGNYASGELEVYDIGTGKLLQKVSDEKGEVLKIPGVMALTNGTNNGAGKVDEIFYSAIDQGHAVFGKLAPIMQTEVGEKKSFEKNKIVTSEDQKLEQAYLQEEDMRPDYKTFALNLKKSCLVDCFQEKFEADLKDLNWIYNKIISDSDIVLKEYDAQGITDERVQKLKDMEDQVSKLSPEKWQDATTNYCNIYSNNFFAGQKQSDEAITCAIYKTEIYSKILYTLRSQYIRVELGPLGIGKNAKTKEFKALIDEEESRINKQY